jgi:hypothetical protein
LIVITITANQIGPSRGLLENPMILHCLIGARHVGRHFVDEVLGESWMPSQSISDRPPLCRFKPLPSNLGDYLVAQCVPGKGWACNVGN